MHHRYGGRVRYLGDRGVFQTSPAPFGMNLVGGIVLYLLKVVWFFTRFGPQLLWLGAQVLWLNLFDREKL